MEVMNDRRNDGKAKNDKKTNRSGWSNYFDSKKKEGDPDAMFIDRLSPEKRSALMKKGACFKCEKPGHMAKDHDEYERKEKEKKKTTASARRTEASTSTTTTTSKTPSKATTSSKRDMKKISALLQTLSTEEREELEELLALQTSEQEKEEKEEDCESDSGF